jgi:cytochrome P450
VLLVVWLLAKDQASQQRTYEEAKAVAGDGPITAAYVEALSYCRQVIQEAMRLFPPAPGIGRQARAAMELGGMPIAPSAFPLLPAINRSR